MFGISDIKGYQELSRFSGEPIGLLGDITLFCCSYYIIRMRGIKGYQELSQFFGDPIGLLAYITFFCCSYYKCRSLFGGKILIVIKSY